MKITTELHSPSSASPLLAPVPQPSIPAAQPTVSQQHKHSFPPHDADLYILVVVGLVISGILLMTLAFWPALWKRKR